MTDQELRYDVMVQMALRNVVKEALKLAADHGLPGDHHFYLAFNPQHPEATVPQFLQDRFGEEMSIVLQHQFWNLSVSDDGFGVTLQFDQKPYDLWVPFDALRGFFDPSVQFGLQFQDDDDAEDGIDDETGSHLGLANIDGETEDDLSDLSDDELFAGLDQTSDGEVAEDHDHDGAADNEDKDDSDAPKSGEVIALDQFRKKP